MPFKLFIAVTCVILAWPRVAEATLPVGKPLPTVTLSGDAGGKVSGGTWDSTTVRDQVTAIFYVDPDEADLNDHVSNAIKKEGFPGERFGSVAIINMKASWKPNFAINSRLEEKQEKFPRTVYVRDNESLLVDKWSMKDHSNNVILVDPSGNVLFSVDGKLSDAQVDELIGLIQAGIR